MSPEEISKFLGFRRREKDGRFAPENGVTATKELSPEQEIFARYAKLAEQLHEDIPMVPSPGVKQKRKKKPLTADVERQRMADRKRAESKLALAMYKELAAIKKPVSNPRKESYERGAANDPYLLAAKKGIVTKALSTSTDPLRPLKRVKTGLKEAAGNPTRPINTTKLGVDHLGMPVARKLDQQVFGKNRVLNRLDGVHVTPEQARSAGVMGQIGGGVGAVTGAAIGAGIGAAAKHPGQGAGIGAMAGGALGGSGGAALGLYTARPSAPRRKGVKQLRGTAPKMPPTPRALATPPRKLDTVAKGVTKGQVKAGVVGATAGAGASLVASSAAERASQRLVRATWATKDLATFNRTRAKATTLTDAARHLSSPVGRATVIGGATAAAVHLHNKKRTVPIAKMDDETKTKLARGGLIGAQIADVAAIKSAWHETTTAKKTGTGIGDALSYGAKKAALPIVAGGLVASIGAERVMHSQQKKLKAAQTAQLKPKTNVINPQQTKVAKP